MRRALTALTLVAVTALGAVVFGMGSAGAWKCDKHPERAPNCTTSTTGPPVSVSQPDPPTSVATTVPASSTTTTSSTTVPPSVPPEVPPYDPPSVIRLAG
jgi:hypothetical protein